MPQFKDAVMINTKHDHITAYPPVSGMDPQGASIETDDNLYELPADEAELLARTIAPGLDPEQVKDVLSKPYQEKAAAALKDLQETIEFYTRELNISRTGEYSGVLVADTLENLLLALSEPVVALRELAEGNV